MKRKLISFAAVICLVAVSFISCSKSNSSASASAGGNSSASAGASASAASAKSIAVFVPGIAADSPVYAMLVAGVEKGAEKANATRDSKSKVSVTILEAGTNQAEWGTKLTALAAEMKYDVIISANSSLPDLAEPLTMQFPEQKFIFLDATKSGNKNIATVCYNQREQSYITGYIAGLMSKSHKLGLVAAQEYPVMNNVILPGFIEGAKAANPASEVDFRIVGNWYDASRGSEITTSLYNTGVDVVLPICGGAAQGVISAAKELGIYITWFDNNGFARAPGTIISSTSMEQEKMAEQVTLAYLAGEIVWGTAESVGMGDGFIDFVQDDANYISTVPENVRNEMSRIVDDIKTGKLVLEQKL